ncbi:MAG: hypothetical protein ACK5X3_03215 [Pseudomonadota bacterium]
MTEAERIKALETHVAELERLLLEFCRAAEGLHDHRGTSTRVRSLTLLKERRLSGRGGGGQG